MTVLTFLAAAAGGATLRHAVRIWSAHLGPVPIGTLVVNLAGAFAAGFVAGWGPPELTVVAVAGVGSLTTFSAFSADVVELRAEGWGWLVAYLAASLVGGIGLAWAGLGLS